MTVTPATGYEISALQQHAWRWTLRYGARFCGVVGVIAIRGPLCRARLAESFAQVAARHEILRTSFAEVTGLEFPVQVVAAKATIELGEFTPHKNNNCEDGQVWERFYRDVSIDPARTERPSIRAALADKSDGSHLLMVALSGLCADRATLHQLFCDVSRAYSESLASATDEPLQYADLATWQNALQTGPQAAEAAEFWRRQESAALGGGRWTRERPIANGDAFAPEIHSEELPESAFDSVQLMAQCCGSRPGTVLEACFRVLLWRMLRQPEVVVGVPFDLRERHDLTGCLGPLTPYQPVASRLDERSTLATVVRNTQDALDNARRWCDVFAGAHRPSGPAECAFGFEFAELPPEIAIANICFSLDVVHACLHPFRLKLECSSRAGRLVTTWWYDASVVSSAEVARLSERFRTLISHLVTQEDTPIGKLSIVGPQERRELTEVLACGPCRTVRYDSLTDMIDEHARMTPDRIAVVAPEGRVTYGDLVTRADALARRLGMLGVGAGTRIGLYADRSLETIVGILGVLKSQAAFVPLDPEYPAERNRMLSADAEISFLLTPERHRSRALEFCRRVVCFSAGAAIPEFDIDAASPNGQPEKSEIGQGQQAAGDLIAGDLAYVVYTSGTTGHPKGALIARSNLAHYVQVLSEPLAISSDDAYLHTAAMGFSSSMRQWFLPLSHGARVVVASNDERRDPLALFDLIRREGVTIVDLVPSHWRNCLHALGEPEVKQRRELLANKVRLCLSASEPLTSDIPRTWSGDWKLPGCFVNMFGHTETCGIISTFPVATVDDKALVPLGRPLANTRIYLLDEQNQPVPWGEVGEACVGGPGVGPGYLNRNEITRRQFLPDPFVADPSARIYRTGDLARYLPDGNLEYVSRRDGQVKIRGHRVEVAEIEAILSRHDSIRACAVAIRSSAGGDQQLVAYIVPRTAAAPTRETLRSYVTGLLPAHMIPSAFVVLRELPMTPTGKLDRNALPAPEGDGRAAPDRKTTNGPIEAALAGIWQSVLGVAEVGAGDNFFDLGGHSLLATRLMTRVWNAFRVQLPMRVLFEAPTVAEFARALIANEARPGLTEKAARILVQAAQTPAVKSKENGKSLKPSS